MEYQEDYEEVLESIVKSNSDVRLVAICGNYGGIMAQAKRPGVQLLLSEKDTEKLIGEAIHSWHTRRLYEQKIGKGHYAMAIYDKLVRLTIPLNEYQILLVTLENTVQTPLFVGNLKQILKDSPRIILE